MSVNNNRINYKNYTLLDFDYAHEKKEGLTTLCSILTSVFDVNSYSNMEYYNNIYPELVNSIFDIKNSIHRNIILTYSQSNHNFIPLIPVEVKELLKGKIILHKSGIGDLHIKGNIDTGKSYNTAIESINIELDQNNKLYNMVYSVKVGNQEWSRWFKEGEGAGTKGQSQAIIGLDINIFDQDQNDIPCICYAQFENDKVIYKYNGGTLFTSPTKRNLVNFAICLSDK